MQVARECSPFGRVIVTGSGMGALLDALRRVQSNGFTLWDACTRLPIGREPPPAVALEMAERLVREFSQAWPAEVREFVTAPRLIKVLQATGRDALFSPRPALMSRALAMMGDARLKTPNKVFDEAIAALALKLVEESAVDVARLLLTMDAEHRKTLRCLADGERENGVPIGAPIMSAGASAQAFDDASLAEKLEQSLFPGQKRLSELAASLCEAEWPPRLLPPYGRLVRSWVERDGSIAFAVERDRLVLEPTAAANLLFISDFSSKQTRPDTQIPESAREAASSAVLKALLQNGIGCASSGGLRVPCSHGELGSIPAVGAVVTALHEAEFEKTGGKSPHATALAFTRKKLLGWWLLKALRHVGGHVYFDTPHVLRNGLTAVTATAAVRAAVAAIVNKSGGKILADGKGRLYFPGDVAK